MTNIATKLETALAVNHYLLLSNRARSRKRRRGRSTTVFRRSKLSYGSRRSRPCIPIRSLCVPKRRWHGMGRAAKAWHFLSALCNLVMERSMLQTNYLSRSFHSRSFTALNQDVTLIAVIEMSQSSWLVAGMAPGVERQPLKKLSRTKTNC